MYQVPTCPLYPPQLQPQNMGVPMQYNSHHIDQQRQGINTGGETPYPYSIPAPMSYGDPNQVGKPMRNCPQTWNSQHFKSHGNQQSRNWSNGYSWQALEIKSPVSPKSPKLLNSLKQLHGNFKIASANLKVKVSDEKTEKEGKVCNLVHRVRDDGETLPDQLLWEEDKQFNLCSTDGCFNATILKGSNVQKCVTWVTKDSGNKVIWERSKDQICQSSPLSTATPHKYTPGSETPVSCSLSFKSNSAGSPELSRCHFNDINRELNTQFARLNHFDSNHQHFNSSRKYCRSSADATKISQQDHALFELIKAQCNSNAWLKEKVVEWGISHGSKSSRITKENAKKLSHGRLWITIRSTQSEEEGDESFDSTLDDLKGAYQQCEPGVWKQPAPQGSEKGAQHRLLRSSVGLWVIEKYNFEGKAWSVRAREEPDGRWMDLKNNRMIHVTLVPLLNVLEKLREGGTAFHDVEKHLDFLFNSCNQRKLNGKLRTRNLNHNIANLKAKLEKQYALSFSVIVARTADSIA